jgi:hypothetical protein
MGSEIVSPTKRLSKAKTKATIFVRWLPLYQLSLALLIPKLRWRMIPIYGSLMLCFLPKPNAWKNRS